MIQIDSIAAAMDKPSLGYSGGLHIAAYHSQCFESFWKEEKENKDRYLPDCSGERVVIARQAIKLQELQVWSLHFNFCLLVRWYMSLAILYSFQSIIVRRIPLIVVVATRDPEDVQWVSAALLLLFSYS